MSCNYLSFVLPMVYILLCLTNNFSHPFAYLTILNPSLRAVIPYLHRFDPLHTR